MEIDFEAMVRLLGEDVTARYGEWAGRDEVEYLADIPAILCMALELHAATAVTVADAMTQLLDQWDAAMAS